MKPYSNKSSKILLNVLFLICFTINVSLGQDMESTPKFVFWTVGNSIKPRLGYNWYKNLNELKNDEHNFYCLLQALATEPQTKEEILSQCTMSSAWLNKAVDSLIFHNCLGKTSNSEIYTKIPIITNKEMKYLQEKLNIISSRVAKKIKEDIPKVIEIYMNAKSESDPNWKEISHLVVDKLLIDGYFHRGLTTLEKKKGLKKHYSLDQKKIPVFFLEEGSKYGTFGVNWYGIKGDNLERHVYVLHGAPFNRYDIPFNKYGREKYFAEIFHRIDIDGSLAKLSKEETQIIKELGWIDNDKLAVPFIQANTIKVFQSDLKKIGNDAAAVVFENFPVIIDSYQESSYSKKSEGAGDYIQVCYHLLFSGIIQELIKLEVIPPIPDPTPEYYGVYITIGSFFN